MADTLLVITGAEMTPYAVRGITQTLSPIGPAVARRSINGALVNLTAPELQKYRATLACSDQDVPAWDGLAVGQTVTVDCIAELSYRTSGGSPARTVVSGSSRTEGDFTFYRPRLSMMVMDYTTTTDEWGAEVGWSIELEEV